MSAHRVSRLLFLPVIILTPCSMAQILYETKERKVEPKSVYVRTRFKKVMQQVITLLRDPENTAFPSNLPTASPLVLDTVTPTRSPSKANVQTQLPSKTVDSLNIYSFVLKTIR